MRILAIDLGNTVVHKKSKEPFPHAFRVIKRFVENWDKVVVISKVNEEQKVRSLAWLEERDFYGCTGIARENIHYCPERKDKGPIAERLGVTHFIDDNPECMIYMPIPVKKLLYDPREDRVLQAFNRLHNVKIVKDWFEIEIEWLSHV